MKYSRKRLTLAKESGETVVCRQGVVNTRQSGVFVALFTRLFFFFFFFLKTSAEVSPFARLTRCWCVMWEMYWPVLWVLKDGGGGGGRAPFPHTFHSGPSDKADRGVLLTRTNCLSVRSEQIVLWVSLAGWWKESTSLKCRPAKPHLPVDCGGMWCLVSFLFDLKNVGFVLEP